MAREEIRRLHRELAQTVLQKAIEKDGSVLPEGAWGDQIRQAVGIMDGPVRHCSWVQHRRCQSSGGYTPSTSTESECSRMAKRAEVARPGGLLMDGPVTKALQLGAAHEALELWQVPTEHINRVFENGGKGQGRQAWRFTCFYLHTSRDMCPPYKKSCQCGVQDLVYVCNIETWSKILHVLHFSQKDPFQKEIRLALFS